MNKAKSVRETTWSSGEKAFGYRCCKSQQVVWTWSVGGDGGGVTASRGCRTSSRLASAASSVWLRRERVRDKTGEFYTYRM